MSVSRDEIIRRLSAPLAVTAIGGKFAINDNRQIPDTLEVVWEYDKCLVTFSQINANRSAGNKTGAEMEFRGVPVGPFVGRDAIAAAYRDQPPDDELRILQERRTDGRVEARYAWLAEPDVPAGELFLTHENDAIRKLVVTFDRGVTWS